AAVRIAASRTPRSRSATTERIERSFQASPLNTGWSRRANLALESTIRPCLSTVAIAIGVFWKKRTNRTSAARCESIEPSRARLMTSVRDEPGVPSGPKATLWNSRTGTVRPPRVLRSMSRISVFTSPGRAGERVREPRAPPRHDLFELEAARADLGKIIIEPIGQRSVDIDDVAVAFCRKEAGRRMIEIVDRVLQLLEYILVPLEIARHVRERPHRHARFAFTLAERTHADAQPPPAVAALRVDAHFLLGAAPFACRLEQTVHGFRNSGIAHEGPLDRPHVPSVGRADEFKIGGVGVNHAAIRVGDEEALAGMVDHGRQQRPFGWPS